ncbi:MAG TPA: ATP-binding protein [Planctomycetota bacterium]|nr:ATP-binding protein [Planctomycetota bacterium]
MGEVKLNELTKALSSSLSMSEERSGRFVDAFVESVKSSLAASKEVSLPGFGGLSLASADGKPVPSMYKANVLGDVCAKLGEANEQRVRSTMDAVMEAVKKELLAGKRVVLDDLGVFEIKSERPEIERQPKGHRLIRPAAAGVTFTSANSVKTAAGEARVVFAPSDDLKKRLESFKESSIMLVVPERDFFTKTLEYYFESAGWEIEVFTKVVDALVKIESGKAYLVILDAMFEDYQKFAYALKMRRETTNVPLLLMYPTEASFKVLKEVTIVGDENLPQPFEFRQLLDHADSEIIRAAEEELIFLQQLNIHLPTDEPSIEKVIDMVHKLLETSGLNEEGQVAMSAAFREAAVNAAQHGNKYKRDKKIEVQYLLDAEKITTVVKDQGTGFNHEQFVKSGSTRDAITAARERHAQGRMGGLGIMLMLRCCDRLEYNQNGNQITLTKFLKPQE